MKGTEHFKVVIRFQICIFDILNTAGSNDSLLNEVL